MTTRHVPIDAKRERETGRKQKKKELGSWYIFDLSHACTAHTVVYVRDHVFTVGTSAVR